MTLDVVEERDPLSDKEKLLLHTLIHEGNKKPQTQFLVSVSPGIAQWGICSPTDTWGELQFVNASSQELGVLAEGLVAKRLVLKQVYGPHIYFDVREPERVAQLYLVDRPQTEEPDVKRVYEEIKRGPHCSSWARHLLVSSRGAMWVRAPFGLHPDISRMSPEAPEGLADIVAKLFSQGRIVFVKPKLDSFRPSSSYSYSNERSLTNKSTKKWYEEWNKEIRNWCSEMQKWDCFYVCAPAS